jgi:hypothetical protein
MQHLELHDVLKQLFRALVNASVTANKEGCKTTFKAHDSWLRGLELLKKSPEERERVRDLANTALPACSTPGHHRPCSLMPFCSVRRHSRACWGGAKG